MLIRGGRNYLAKGNYNIARMAYIQELFPDARFIVPIRHPVSHIASLIRQHQVFSKGQEKHAAARDYLRRVGHFEFGLDRTPMNMGNADAIHEILGRWSASDELGGWALYWSHVYGAVMDQLENDGRLREAVLIVRYEDLCGMPQEVLPLVVSHCRLGVDAQMIDNLSRRVQSREYYKSGFSRAETQHILQATESTMLRYGYLHA